MFPISQLVPLVEAPPPICSSSEARGRFVTSSVKVQGLWLVHGGVLPSVEGVIFACHFCVQFICVSHFGGCVTRHLRFECASYRRYDIIAFHRTFDGEQRGLCLKRWATVMKEGSCESSVLIMSPPHHISWGASLVGGVGAAGGLPLAHPAG